MRRTLALAATLSSACTVLSVDGDELPVVEHEAVMTMNAMTMNGLSMNELVFSTRLGAMTLNGLTARALVSNPGVPEALRDPDARMFLRYLVSCALPAGQHFELAIDGTVHAFDGELGLAPEWGASNGSCGPECRGWVSACMMARVNAKGAHVAISLRGEHPELRADRTELRDFPTFEAGYFGDVFAPEQVLHACTRDGTPAPRVCGSGEAAASCVIDTLGSCEEVCSRPARQRSYGICDGDPEVVTVYLGR